MIGLVLAKAAGAVTIITSSSDAKLKLAREEYGADHVIADHVINYKSTLDRAAKALRLTDGEGVAFILENGGSGSIAQVLVFSLPFSPHWLPCHIFLSSNVRTNLRVIPNAKHQVHRPQRHHRPHRLPIPRKTGRHA